MKPINPYVFQFLPIIIIFFYLTYHDRFVRQSQTVLGRAFAIGLIVYYTTIKRLYGLFAVIFVVIFYQFETEDLLKEGFDVELMKVDNHDIQPPIQTPSSREFAEYSDAYSPDYVNNHELQIEQNNSKYSQIKEKFRKEYCEAGYLKYKNHVVKPDMAEIIFPDLHFFSFKTPQKGAVMSEDGDDDFALKMRNGVKFENEYKCNPCDPNCSFTISHLNSEFDIIEPKSSNDWVKENTPFMKVVFGESTNFVPKSSSTTL